MSETYYIKHIQRARFDVPVFCEPLSVFLHPRTDAQGQARTTRLDISPQPARIRSLCDLAGNLGWYVTFRELTVGLTVSVTSVIERQRPHVDHELRDDETSWKHINSGNRLARCYIDGCIQDDEVESLYEQVLDRGHGATPLRFLRSLATELSHQYNWDLQCVRTSRVEARRMLSTIATLPPRIAERMRAFRPVPVPVPAPVGTKSEPTSRSEQLLSDNAGCAEPCRRTVEQFVSVARLAHLPTRFVAGYCAASSDEVATELSTWVECHLGNAGWVGFDPCRGQVADGSYIAVHSAEHLSGLKTIAGEFRGGSNTPQWMTQIIVRQQ